MCLSGVKYVDKQAKETRDTEPTKLRQVYKSERVFWNV